MAVTQIQGFILAKTEQIGPERNGVQVTARAASVLRAFEDEPQGLSLGDLASRLRLARSTVQRIVTPWPTNNC